MKKMKNTKLSYTKEMFVETGLIRPQKKIW